MAAARRLLSAYGMVSRLVVVVLALHACASSSPPDQEGCDTPEGCDVHTPLAKELLGAHYSTTETSFGIWSPEHHDVQLWLDGTLIPLEVLGVHAAPHADMYWGSVPGDHSLKSYHFVIDGAVVRDPYAKMVQPNSDEAVVMDMSLTALSSDWASRPALVQREDAIIYELHVRDFSIDASSGSADDARGRYLGLVEEGTTHQGMATGIDHLKELGVTHVQLMPVYDFASCPDLEDAECYNWGYDPRNYSVPEERYSATPLDPVARVQEFKFMVDAFHKAGIRVILDVVYNHTHNKSMFENISPSYYTNADLSGTGNSIDARVPMVSQLIADSLEYWVQEYNIDGFRFDLFGVFDHASVGSWATHLNETFPERQLLIYGEPWNGNAPDDQEAERLRLGTVGRLWEAHVGAFNSIYRNALKGDNDSGGCQAGDCYIFNGPDASWKIAAGTRGSLRIDKDASNPIDTWSANFAMDPEQTINYVSAHDNLSLRDKILKWAETKNIESDSLYLKRLQMFANGIVLTSQGIAFLHGGAELMRDKKGDHNSYRSSDAVNRIDWSWKLRNADVFAYYKDLIALRKAHPALRMTSWEAIQANIYTTTPRPGVVVNRINGTAVGDDWSELLVIYNSGDNLEYSLPEGAWKVALERSDASAGQGRVVEGSVVAEGTAVTLLYRSP